MRTTANLGQILGVRVRLHRTWAVAFILIAAAVVTQFPTAYPLWQRIVLGIAAGLLFFTAICIREFILSYMAASKGIPVKNITLFIFGGVSQVTGGATRPILELLMAVVGLLSILGIAGVFYIAYIVWVSAGSILVTGLIQWLAFITFMLFLFHFVPGFPLDGGRIFLAALWKVTGDYDRAKRIASWAGQGIGLALIVGGTLALFSAHQWFIGSSLAFSGWVLQSAAAQSRRQSALHEALRDITVGDIMTQEYLLITEPLSIASLVRSYILVTGQRYIVVAGDGRLQGVVTLSDIKRIPRARWDTTWIHEIMTPASDLKISYPREPAANLLEQMTEMEINQMPVVEQDRVTGVISKYRLLRLFKTRTEIKI